MARVRLAIAYAAIAAAALLTQGGAAHATPPPPTPTAGTNVRVTLDNGTSTWKSADQLAGGSYTDAVLARCTTDRRQQNEPTLAIDPRNPDVWAAGSNNYCTTATVGDAWAGFYRSSNGGGTWTNSLLPGYLGDSSTQGAASPLSSLVAGGAIASGDPVMAWDGSGNLFFMGNNFNRGTDNGNSGFTTRDNIGSVWVATYAPKDPSDNRTDGQKYVRTVVLAQNTFGLGSSNDKTAMAVDPATGIVYAAWSDFRGSGGASIMFSRSTDHGASFSTPVRLSAATSGNQGPSIAIGAGGQVFVSWVGSAGGPAMNSVTGAAFVSSADYGKTFTNARIAVPYRAFDSSQFSGNGARDCGDGPYACPTGFTFPRFDLAQPYLAADTVHGTVVMAFQTALPSGQGQIQVATSTDGGSHWSTPTALAPSGTGHQFFPYLVASAGRVSAIWYDSRGDGDYAATRPPCNSATGATSACLNVRYAASTDGGSTWGTSIRVTSRPFNPNYEQFGGRRVPFLGDYITVAAQGDRIGAVWADQRDTVAAADRTGDADGADVAGDPETGGTCTSLSTTCFDTSGGLDQNVYAAVIRP
ncbi:sialidase family protein [Raineyella fluvialis]|uniref:Exo-alpha-sialidase n=1 Tax=Raineyella fluvialis TaxID=2662261 RepID=A0A5Q2FAP1_9ACTN|nr:sialidase family protein [Raineyella fluvialis]QGF23451.1 hypothetical protein Rai3103_06970 [Raineyella fluvialis]